MSANHSSKSNQPRPNDPGRKKGPDVEPLRKPAPEIDDEPPGDSDSGVRSPGGLPRFGDDEPDEPRRLDIEAERGGRAAGM